MHPGSQRAALGEALASSMPPHRLLPLCFPPILPADDLAACPFKFFGDAARLAPVAHEWFPEGCPGPDRGRRQEAGEATQLAFTTARQLEQDGAIQGSTSQEAQQAAVLGAELRVADFAAGAAGGAGAAAGPRQRKVYAPVPSKLQAAFDEAKRQAAEAERPAGAPSRPAALPALSAATSKPPLAMRLAAAAAAGGKPAVPTFKKAAAAAAPAAAPKKAGGQKRAPAAGKPPTAPKRAKPAASATPVSAGAAAGGAAGDAGPPPSATKPKAAKPRAPAASAADVGGAGAAAPPKAPAKPRAKAADIDVTAGEENWGGIPANVCLSSKTCAGGTGSALPLLQ